MYPAGLLPQIAAPDSAQDVAGPDRDAWKGIRNLGPFMRASQNVDWADLDVFVRRSASADEQILGLPLYYDIDLLYYRKDVLDRFGFEPPETFEELITQITEMEGTDFNGDGMPDFPICVQFAPNCWAARKDPDIGEIPYVALFMSIIAPMTQVSTCGSPVHQGRRTDFKFRARERTRERECFYSGCLAMGGSTDPRSFVPRTQVLGPAIDAARPQQPGHASCRKVLPKAACCNAGRALGERWRARRLLRNPREAVGRGPMRVRPPAGRLPRRPLQRQQHVPRPDRGSREGERVGIARGRVRSASGTDAK